MFLLAAGRTDEGLACLDEAMLGVAAGECSAMVEGIIYCNVIEACWSVYELTRAQQWTAAMTQWVAAQPEIVQLHRRVQGTPGRAQAAQRPSGRTRSTSSRGELHGARTGGPRAGPRVVRGNLDRMLGRFDSAEEHFTLASRLGEDPQPGLALLRLARGSVQAAAAMARRSLAETRPARDAHPGPRGRDRDPARHR